MAGAVVRGGVEWWCFWEGEECVWIGEQYESGCSVKSESFGGLLHHITLQVKAFQRVGGYISDLHKARLFSVLGKGHRVVLKDLDPDAATEYAALSLFRKGRQSTYVRECLEELAQRGVE